MSSRLGRARITRSPELYAIEPKVDGVRGLVTFEGDTITIRSRQGRIRERWLACVEFRQGLERLAEALPILPDGSVLDGELTAGSFHRTMAVLTGAHPFETSLRLVVFDLPVFGGVDVRHEPWERRRVRLELLSRAFTCPLELSPVVDPSADLTAAIMDGYLEGIVPKHRTSAYRSGSRRGWSKVKSPDWFERHRGRFGALNDRALTLYAAGYDEGVDAGAKAAIDYMLEHPTASTEVVREVVRDAQGRIAAVIERKVPVVRKSGR